MKALRNILHTRFGIEELRSLAANLGLDHEDFPATKEGFAREFVAYLVRKNEIANLITLGRQERPDIDWSEIDLSTIEVHKSTHIKPALNWSIILTITIIVLLLIPFSLFYSQRTMDKEKNLYGKAKGDREELTKGELEDFYNEIILVRLEDITGYPHTITATIITPDNTYHLSCEEVRRCMKTVSFEGITYRINVDSVRQSTEPGPKQLMVNIRVTIVN
jgi:hypothetical protein